MDPTLELLDTPGILWPKFDDPEVGKRLAFTGAVKDDVLDIEELACYLMDYLAAHYADTLTERYKIEVEPGDTLVVDKSVLDSGSVACPGCGQEFEIELGYEDEEEDSDEE